MNETRTRLRAVPDLLSTALDDADWSISIRHFTQDPFLLCASLMHELPASDSRSLTNGQLSYHISAAQDSNVSWLLINDHAWLV